MTTPIHALAWYSKDGASQGWPWWVWELDGTDSPPKRCAEVKWFGGTSRTVFRDGGFTDLPDGPRGIIELHVAELQMIRAPGEDGA